MPPSGLNGEPLTTSRRTRRSDVGSTQATATCFAAACLTKDDTRPKCRQQVKAHVRAINSNDYEFVDTPNAGFNLGDR